MHGGLLNEERPPVWEQVSDWMERNGTLANSDLCRIAAVDTLKASKMLKRWVEQGVLTRDDSGGETPYRVSQAVGGWRGECRFVNFHAPG